MTSEQINRELAAFQRDRDFYNQKVSQGFSIEMIEVLLELDERCRREDAQKAIIAANDSIHELSGAL